MPLKLPDYVHSDNFCIGKDGRTVKVSDRKPASLHQNLIQWVKEPLSKTNRFFEVELLEDVDSLAGQYMMLGTNVATKDGIAMWDMHQSIRYRSLEGGVFTGGAGLRSDVTFGCKGDIILVYLEETFQHKSLINFFLNGTLVYRQFVKVGPGNLYPAIGLDKGPAKFYVTWPGMSKTPNVDMKLVEKTLSSWVGFKNFSKDDSNNILKLNGLDTCPRDGYNIQSPRPLRQDGATYFEIEVLSNQGSSSSPCIGLTPGFTSKFQSPGWKPLTIGYQAFDGKIYNECKTYTETGEENSRCCVVGDRVGCGVVFYGGTEDAGCGEKTVVVYFTKNGQVVFTKPRFMPCEGFYPTIGMNAIGEQVKVIIPCSLPTNLPAVDEVFNKWSPLYTNFRFSEIVKFLDYEVNGTANKLQVDAVDRPTVIQYKKEHSNTCYFRVTIDEIVDEETEIQLGVAMDTILTQGELLLNKPARPALCLSPSKPHLVKIGEGDPVDIVIEKTEAGDQLLLFVIHNRLVQRSHIPNANHDEQMLYPTICVRGGEITLDVVWPDDKRVEEIKPNIVSTDLSYWLCPSCVSVSEKQMVLTHMEDESFVYNVTAPFPLSKKGMFFFQMSYVPSDTPSKPVFPGIGLTVGSFSSSEKLHLMVNDMWTVLFYASSQRLITWKGAKQAENQSETVTPTTVGCSAVYDKNRDVFRLTFYCDFDVEVTTEVEAKGPTGGYYPMFSFQKGTQGHLFSTKLLITDSEDTSVMEGLEDSERPMLLLNPGPEKLYNWRDEDLFDGKSLDEVSMSSDIARERQSLVNNIYISHCAANTKDINNMVQGLQQKGYAIQTTAWNTDEDKVMNLLMAQVIVFCMSPSAIKDSTHKTEFDHAISKNIPLLPVILQSIAWPPSGLYKAKVSAIEKYTDVKLDFSGRQLKDKDIVHIERHLQKAVSVSQEPVVLAPVPTDMNSNLDSKNKGGNGPDSGVYNSDTKSKSTTEGSRSCTVL